MSTGSSPTRQKVQGLNEDGHRIVLLLALTPAAIEAACLKLALEIPLEQPVKTCIVGKAQSLRWLLLVVALDVRGHSHGEVGGGKVPGDALITVCSAQMPVGAPVLISVTGDHA